MNWFKNIFKNKSDFDKPHFIEVNIDCWESAIYFSFNESFEQYKSHFNEKYKDEIQDFGSCVAGNYIGFGDCPSIVYIRMPKVPNSVEDLGTLQHEIFHAVTHILMAKGVKYEKQNHEAFSYMYEYVTKQIYSIIEKYK